MTFYICHWKGFILNVIMRWSLAKGKGKSSPRQMRRESRVKGNKYIIRGNRPSLRPSRPPRIIYKTNDGIGRSCPQQTHAEFALASKRPRICILQPVQFDRSSRVLKRVRYPGLHTHISLFYCACTHSEFKFYIYCVCTTYADGFIALLRRHTDHS